MSISNSSRDVVGIEISQIFKNVSFALNVFDKSEWHAIDDQIVTELHDKLQILPCAFPHAEYLRENYVKYPIDERFKATKTTKTPTKRQKICPADDSQTITKKIEGVKLKKTGRLKQCRRIINKKKTLKRVRRRARIAKEHQARIAETREFESTKTLLLATMDQYSTATEGAQCSNAGSSAIAARTRNRTKTNTPEKSTRPIRRTSMNKTYNDKR